MRLSGCNELLRMEQESNGDILVMSPPGTEGGGSNADLVVELGLWARQDGRGKGFDSNAGFGLPDGSVRAADAAWVWWPRWNALTRDEQRCFSPLCPEFVIELRSPRERLSDLRAKMQMWLTNGAELAWHLDPERKAAEVYRSGKAPASAEGARVEEGEGPIAGFILELARIWG